MSLAAALVCAALVVSSAGVAPAMAGSTIEQIQAFALEDTPFNEWLVSTRRELHKIPELMYNETKTSALIARELSAMGVAFQGGFAGTGIVATIGDGSAPVVALRADMDALPMVEEADVPFKSTHKGRMHACGHDSHVTMLLGGARLLSQNAGAVAGTVKLVFQPAEEGGAGARYMLAGIEDAQAIYGIHVWPDIPTGKIATKPGTLMASAAFFQVTFHGKGCHGAMPHQGIDPVIAAAAAVQSLQSIVSRETAPLDSAVISVTKLQAGSAFNVVPSEAHLGGTVRALTWPQMTHLIQRITAVLEGIAKAHGCTVDIDFMESAHPITPPVVNDAGAYETAKQVAFGLVGRENYEDTITTMGAEDFSYYQQRVPGCFTFLGSGNPAVGATFPIHHPKFKLDEDVLKIGAAFHAATAITALKGLAEGSTATQDREL